MIVSPKHGPTNQNLDFAKKPQQHMVLSNRKSLAMGLFNLIRTYKENGFYWFTTRASAFGVESGQRTIVIGVYNRRQRRRILKRRWRRFRLDWRSQRPTLPRRRERAIDTNHRFCHILASPPWYSRRTSSTTRWVLTILHIYLLML